MLKYPFVFSSDIYIYTMMSITQKSVVYTVSHTESYSEGSACGEFGRLYVWKRGWEGRWSPWRRRRRKGQRNRCIALFHWELSHHGWPSRYSVNQLLNPTKQTMQLYLIEAKRFYSPSSIFKHLLSIIFINSNTAEARHMWVVDIHSHWSICTCTHTHTNGKHAC